MLGQGRRAIYQAGDGRRGMLSALFTCAFYVRREPCLVLHVRAFVCLFNYYGGITFIFSAAAVNPESCQLIASRARMHQQEPEDSAKHMFMSTSIQLPIKHTLKTQLCIFDRSEWPHQSRDDLGQAFCHRSHATLFSSVLLLRSVLSSSVRRDPVCGYPDRIRLASRAVSPT